MWVVAETDVVACGKKKNENNNRQGARHSGFRIDHMETEIETTTSTQSRGPEKDAQSIVDPYVNGMIDYVIEHPSLSIAQICERISWGGPCASPKNILRLLCGPRMFKRICRRTE